MHWHRKRWHWRPFRLPASLDALISVTGWTVITSRACDRCDHVRVRITRGRVLW